MSGRTPENCRFETVTAGDEMSDPTYRRVFNLPAPNRAVVSQTLHVGLLVPPSPFLVPPGWEWVHRAPFEGPSIIAALLKGLGYRVTLFDQRQNRDPEELRNRLDDIDLLGITCYEDNYPYLKRAAEIAKEENPDRRVILGGPLISSLPEVMMADMAADYAVLGEGELTLTELMDHISGTLDAKPLPTIKGLAWKDGEGRVQINQARPQIRNLDVVPFQDFSAWPTLSDREIPEIYLTYSRGCMGNCSFCYRAFPRLAYKSVDRVRREILYYKKWNFRMAWWSDLTFVTDREYLHKLLDEAIGAHQFRWSCFNRVDTADLKLYRKMRQRGCDIILYGLESVAPEILRGYKKGTNRDKIVEAIHITREAGIKCGGLFIIGAPDETGQSLEELIAFCREFKEVTRIKYLSLIPGTANYREAVNSGAIPDQLAHLHWLAAELSSEEDVDHPGFVKVADRVSREDLRRTYRTVNNMIEARPYQYWSPAPAGPASS